MDPLKEQIRRLQNLNSPYYPTTSTVKKVRTQVNHFPYTRFYTSDYRQPYVTFFDREAGWSKLDNQCYKNVNTSVFDTPVDYCFAAPASIVYPCHRDNEQKGKCGHLNKNTFS